MGSAKLQSNKVLYLSYDGLTDPLGQSQILPYLIGLAGKGYYITLISFEKSERFETGEAAIENLCKQNSIDWIPLHYHKTPPIVSTLYDVYMLWRTSRNQHRIENFAIVHCRSYITALVGLRLKRLFGIKFIFDMRGFWADERVEGGLWNVKNPAYRLVYNFFKRKEKLFLEESDHVISLTHNAKIEIKSWKINTPITVIPTCVDLELFDPAKIIEAEKQNLKTELGIGKDDFVLLYLGSWGTWYLTEQMLDFFVEVKGQKPQSKFLIVSPDSINVADKPFADDVIIRSVKRAEVPKYISIASAAVFFIKPTFSKKASSATKMGEIMAMNIPLITNTGWGDIDIITFEDVIVLKDFESESINQAVKRILQMKTLPNSGKSLVDQSASLSLTSGIIRYDSVYHELLSFSE